jgi:CRP/FNR family transcriptional regulator, cyclic AMP receptor protein
MTAMWFFNDVNLFSILCPHKIKELKKEHCFDTYQKGDFVYFEKDVSNKLYLIEKGKVKIGYYNENGDEVVKVILTRGEIFGEKSLLGEENRNEFAQSVESDTSICPVNTDTMQTLLRNNTDLSLKIYKFIGFRFKKLERRLEILLFKDVKTRLLEFIKELSSEYGYKNVITGDVVIKHPYTQKDISSLIGTSRPTLNLYLNELRLEGIIDFNQKEMFLKNHEYVS